MLRCYVVCRFSLSFLSVVLPVDVFFSSGTVLEEMFCGNLVFIELMIRGGRGWGFHYRSIDLGTYKSGSGKFF